MKKTQKGFTLIELLVGVLISVMIFLTAGSMIALLFRTDMRTKNTENLEQTKNDIQGELSNKIRWAQDISFSPSSLTLDETEYTLTSGRLLKNGDPLTSSDVVIKSFNILNLSRSTDIYSLEITIEMENKHQTTAQDIMKLVVSQRKTTFEQ